MIGIGLWIERFGPYTPPSYITDGAVHSRCQYAAQSRIQEIGFPDITSPTTGSAVSLNPASVVVLKLPLERIYKRQTLPLSLPCILITPGRVQHQPTLGVTDKDDYLKPCLVTIVMPDNAEPTLQLNLDAMVLWLEKITRAFNSQRLAGVSEVLICHVEPAETVIPEAFGQNVLASALLLKFRSREIRGLS